MEVEARRRRKRTRLIFWIVLGAILAGAGILLSILSTAPDVRELDQEVFTGSVAPGSDVVPINRTGFGWVEIEGEVLPCGLSILAVTAVQAEAFNETRILPQGGIDCNNLVALIKAEATHVALLNTDLTETLSFRVRATYFSVSQPYALLLFPGLGLVGAGLLLIGVVMYRRY